MSDKKEVSTVEKKQYNAFEKAIAFAVVSSALVASPAFAEGGISTIGAGLNTEVEASKAIVLALFGIGATVLALFAGYRYMKRGANSA